MKEIKESSNRKAYIAHAVLGFLSLVPAVLLMFSMKTGESVKEGFSLFTKLLFIGIVAGVAAADGLLAAVKKLSGKTALICFGIFAGITAVWLVGTLIAVKLFSVL